MYNIQTLGENAKKASYSLAVMSTADKNKMLTAIANALVKETDTIITANKIDISNAKENGIADAMVDRLLLNADRIKDISDSVLEIVALDDPIGSIDCGFIRPNGLNIQKTRVPLGVIGIIFESRPNVTVDAATLCIKGGNAVILRGGKEAINSNKALTDVMRNAITSCGFNPNFVALVEDTSREVANEMMKMSQYLDVLIPRGGAGLINAVLQNATVPVIETGTGNCHIYVDNTANFDMATEIVYNAKVSRPSVCNAAESLLVHKDIANEFLPIVFNKLSPEVKLYGCDITKKICGDNILSATDTEYATEFNDYIMSIKVVDTIDDAIEHINKFGTGHSEAIVTTDLDNSRRFTSGVDAAAVYVNASTRFTDGGVFGFGAEIGISTQKLHARGPMGLHELTSIKYIINGTGQTR